MLLCRIPSPSSASSLPPSLRVRRIVSVQVHESLYLELNLVSQRCSFSLWLFPPPPFSTKRGGWEEDLSQSSKGNWLCFCFSSCLMEGGEHMAHEKKPEAAAVTWRKMWERASCLQASGKMQGGRGECSQNKPREACFTYYLQNKLIKIQGGKMREVDKFGGQGNDPSAHLWLQVCLALYCQMKTII